MVCDERNHRDQVFELSEKFVTKFGSKGVASVETLGIQTTSSPPFFLGDSRAGETGARVKITPREKRRYAAGREKNGRLFSRGVIFTGARVSLALLSLRKNGGLLVVY